MADTEFSGELAGLESAVFNPHMSYQTKRVVEYVTSVTDKAVVDFLVHGKETMTQVYDVTIGDLPLAEKEPVKVILNPKWYSEEKWNEIQTAHRVPATCSIPYRPEYIIIHTAPYPIKPVESPYPLDDEHKFVFTPVPNPVPVETPKPTGLDIPEPMTEAVPCRVSLVTSQVISERDDSRDNMEYDAAYAALTGRALSPFFGLKGMRLIDAKLKLLVTDEDDEEEEQEQNDEQDDEQNDILSGVDCIDEGEGDEDYFEEEDDKEKSEEEEEEEKELEEELYNLEHRPSHMSNSQLIYHYKANYTDKCRPRGTMSDEDYQTLDFKGVVLNHIPGKIRFDDDDEFDEPVLATHKPGKWVGKVVHYRAGHWLFGDVVETQKPRVKVTYPDIHVDKETFYRRTRIQGHRGGMITATQWKWLFGFDKVPQAIKDAPSGVHPLAPLLGMERVSARFVDGLRICGYTVELRRVGDSHREVWCLIV